ncbi:sirohydrochlorin chelatase [Tropicimonas sp.]|uniref:sirohydrochlorin chelatase n=1 Tax=Tropicimonas sp. TaxID=2067044 RepID=UPI003A84A637
MAPVTEHHEKVLIVAHGSPSNPAPQEAALGRLATRVAEYLPGWRVAGATLAAPGRFDAAVADLGRPVIYPFFMARGWFTGKVLARRAAERGLHVLRPFGTESALARVARDRLAAIMAARNWRAAETSLLIAAHGSAISKTSANSARDFAEAVAVAGGFARVRLGFLEQPPFLTDAARGLGRAICLPWLATASGHMEEDVPAELAAAGFTGPVLPPFIDWADTAPLIAAGILRQHSAARVSLR